MTVHHLKHTVLGLQSWLTTAAKPALVSGQGQEVVSYWAKPYRQKLQALPPPSKFGTMWSAFQTPQGNLADEVQFDRHGPVLNIYRPQHAKVWPNRPWLRRHSSCHDVPSANSCINSMSLQGICMYKHCSSHTPMGLTYA